MTNDNKSDGPGADDLRFAQNMLVLREQKGLSQADLVRRLRENGWHTVHQTTISRIENGERPVRFGEARAIAQALEVTADRLLMPDVESRMAGLLDWFRSQLEKRGHDVVRAASEWSKAHKHLQAQVDEVRSMGFEPSTSHIEPGSTATLSDELRLATDALGVSITDLLARHSIEVVGFRMEMTDDDSTS